MIQTTRTKQIERRRATVTTVVHWARLICLSLRYLPVKITWKHTDGQKTCRGLWCSEICSLMSLDAPEFHAFSDVREPISLHQAVYRISLLFSFAYTVVHPPILFCCTSYKWNQRESLCSCRLELLLSTPAEQQETTDVFWACSIASEDWDSTANAENAHTPTKQSGSNMSDPVVTSAAPSEREVAGLMRDDQRRFTPLARARRQSLPVWPPTLRFSVWLIQYFLKTYVYTPSTPCRDVKFCPNIPLDDLSWNALTEVMWHHQINGFSNSKFWKNLTRKRSRRIGKWLVWQFCLTLWMK